MKKYQLSVTISKAADKNSAASKAVTDCSRIFQRNGYQNYGLIFSEGLSTIKYQFLLFTKLFSFYSKLDRNAIVGIQYPLLNNVFKYFIKAASLKKVKFFCIIHDVESLRLGGTNEALVSAETRNLNYYHYIIVHNDSMLQWLKTNGVTTPMYPLVLFDYLTIPSKITYSTFKNTIVFAGNLAKSKFIYQLNQISGCKFNVYGPNYNGDYIAANVIWAGEYAPDEIVSKLDGDFGLIWDGDSVAQQDASWGNYLRYNNPHKFSLYLAAGLPVIAPKNSAIAKLILKKNIGLLIDNLYDLSQITISQSSYQIMRDNCLKLRKKIINGYYFEEAINIAEQHLNQTL